jgi:hypothetical protein
VIGLDQQNSAQISAQVRDRFIANLQVSALPCPRLPERDPSQGARLSNLG